MPPSPLRQNLARTLGLTTLLTLATLPQELYAYYVHDPLPTAHSQTLLAIHCATALLSLGLLAGQLLLWPALLLLLTANLAALLSPHLKAGLSTAPANFLLWEAFLPLTFTLTLAYIPWLTNHLTNPLIRSTPLPPPPPSSPEHPTPLLYAEPPPDRLRPIARLALIYTTALTLRIVGWVPLWYFSQRSPRPSLPLRDLLIWAGLVLTGLLATTLTFLALRRTPAFFFPLLILAFILALPVADPDLTMHPLYLSLQRLIPLSADLATPLLILLTARTLRHQPI